VNPSSVIWPWQNPPEGGRAAVLTRCRLARVHGTVQALIGAVLGGLVYWKLSTTVAIIAWCIAAVVALAAWLSPIGIYAAIWRGIHVVAHAVGRVLTVVLMAPIYYLFFLPFRVLLRTGMRDRMKRTFPDARMDSFWVVRDKPRPHRDSYQRQF
jgi:hypothetical protein